MDKKEFDIVIAPQAMDFLKKESEKCDEEHDIEMIEFRQRFKEFMKGSDIIRVFPDSDVWEWRDTDGLFRVSLIRRLYIKLMKLFGKDAREVHRCHWMDVEFSKDGHYMSPLCVITKTMMEEDKKTYVEMGELYEESEWDIAIDVSYLTKDNLLVGVKMWIDKYYPEFSNLEVVYEDDEIVKKMQDEILAPILEKCKQAEQDIADGNYYTMEDIKKEFKLDEED